MENGRMNNKEINNQSGQRKSSAKQAEATVQATGGKNSSEKIKQSHETSQDSKNGQAPRKDVINGRQNNGEATEKSCTSAGASKSRLANRHKEERQLEEQRQTQQEEEVMKKQSANKESKHSREARRKEREKEMEKKKKT
ncbi:MAG: hypothetical protein LRY73_04105 [Bacillus sp. (in: Bacteria)]|nr:hypothetical protein [Bacillus sp. (in: firmicutes)]